MRFTDPLPRSRGAGQFARFVIVGAVNSGATYVLYLLLLRLFPYAFAYTVSYVAGIAISLLLNGVWVFRTGISIRTALQFPVVYLVQYLIGVTLLAGLVEKMAVRREFAPLIVLACTVPVTFLLSRLVFRPT